jgi:GDP-4-dehydro-6-deoxy-D-mannose reductase
VAGLLPLVTGGTGFAGGHLLEHLLTLHPAVAAWSHARGRSVLSGDPRITWESVDLLDGPAVRQAIARCQPSAIYHCAGFADVAATWSDPARALAVNVVGTHHVLEGVRAAGLSCPVLVTGSAMVYRMSATALREDDPVVPSTPYGIIKLAQEMRAARDSHPEVLLVRAFNHAGPRQSASYVTSSFARQIAEIEAGHAPPVLHVGNLDSERDITDVRDTVRAYQLLVDRGGRRRPYNVCSGRAYRVGDLLDALLAKARLPIAIQSDAARLRPSDNPMILGDVSRLTAETGWRPEIPIEQTLGDLLDYWRQPANRSSARR